MDKNSEMQMLLRIATLEQNVIDLNKMFEEVLRVTGNPINRTPLDIKVLQIRYLEFINELAARNDDRFPYSAFLIKDNDIYIERDTQKKLIFVSHNRVWRRLNIAGKTTEDVLTNTLNNHFDTSGYRIRILYSDKRECWKELIKTMNSWQNM